MEPHTSSLTASMMAHFVNFSSHSHLTFDASRLMEVLQALIASNNAHELQIAELQREVVRLSSASNRGDAAPIFTVAAASPTTKQHELLTDSHNDDAPPTTGSPKTQTSGDASTQALRSKRLAATSPSKPRSVAPPQQASLSALQSSMDEVRSVFGLDTAQGAKALDAFLDFRSRSNDGGFHLLATLPLIQACSTAVRHSADDASSVLLRGLESKVELLTATVDAIQSALGNKAATAQRLPVAPPSQAAGAAASDPVARVDIAKLQQNLMLVEARLDTVLLSHPAGPTADDHQTKDLEIKIANVIKRMETVEKAVKGSKSAAASPEGSPAAGQDLAMSAPSTLTTTLAIEAVEDKVMQAVRLSKESVLSQVTAQLDGVRASHQQLLEWVQGHESRCAILLASAAGPANEEHASSVERPGSALLVTSGLSPFVPRREKIMEAAASNPRGRVGMVGASGIVSRAAQQHVGGGPTSYSEEGSRNAPVVYKLGASDGLSLSASKTAGVMGTPPRGSLSSSLAAAYRPVTPSHNQHDPKTCVVWKCGWCNAARDTRPAWSGAASPTPN